MPAHKVSWESAVGRQSEFQDWVRQHIAIKEMLPALYQYIGSMPT